MFSFLTSSSQLLSWLTGYRRRAPTDLIREKARTLQRKPIGRHGALWSTMVYNGKTMAPVRWKTFRWFWFAERLAGQVGTYRTHDS